MTIKSITTVALNLPFEVGGPKPLFAGKPRNMEILLVRVETDDGIVGWGEAFGYAVWPATRTALETLIAPLAAGRDERDIAALMLDLQRKLHLLGRSGPVMYAMSGLDIALWDIAGKAAGKSIAELLGGVKRREFSAYASLMRYTDPALVARNAKAAVERGYRAIKLHETGIEQVRVARAAIGPDVKLMIDTNCPWTPAEAVAIAAHVREYDLFWFEEPVWPPEDYAGLARVRRECGIAVSAGENAASIVDFQAMFDVGAVDYAQPSVTKIGGVTEMMRIARLARERGITLVPHSPYFGPGLLATLHMAASFEHECMIEYSYCDLGANPLGDAITVKGGRIALPGGPGLGGDPDPVVLERYRVA
jgi:L-alanine-DL-glutamate epimerase-like enolase superfamily enzyme